MQIIVFELLLTDVYTPFTIRLQLKNSQNAVKYQEKDQLSKQEGVYAKKYTKTNF